MFESKASDFNIVDATSFEKYSLKELASAAHKEGIKLGFIIHRAKIGPKGMQRKRQS